MRWWDIKDAFGVIKHGWRIPHLARWFSYPNSGFSSHHWWHQTAIVFSRLAHDLHGISYKPTQWRMVRKQQKLAVETIGSFYDIDMSLEEQKRAVLHGKFLIIASHCYMLLPRIPEKWHQNKWTWSSPLFWPGPVPSIWRPLKGKQRPNRPYGWRGLQKCPETHISEQYLPVVACSSWIFCA